jgi:tetratricopeptide (TPR) repeat protein
VWIAASLPVTRAGAQDLSRAEELLKAGKHAEAAAAYKAVVEQQADNGPALLGLGKSLYLGGKPEDAIPHLNAAARGLDKNAEAWTLLGQACFDYAQQMIQDQARGSYINALFDDAENALKKAMEQDPKALGAALWLGRLHLAREENESAVKVLGRAAEIDPKNAWAPYYLGEAHYAAKNYGQALEAYAKAAELSPGWLDPLRRLVWTHIAAGETEKAEEALGRALEAGAERTEAYEDLAALYGNAKQYDKITAFLQGHVKKHPSARLPLFYLGYYQALAGKVDDAIKSYERLVADEVAAKNWPNAQFQLGKLLIEKGQTDRGTKFVLRAFQADANNQEVYDFLRMRAGVAITGERLSEAERLLKVLCDGRPDDGLLWADMGLVLRDQSKYEDSFKYYKRAAELLPQDPQVLNDCGVVLHYHLKKEEEGLKFYKKSEELSKGECIDAVENLGVVYFDHGQYEKARDQFERVLKKEAGRTKALDYLKRIERKLKKTKTGSKD